MTPLSADGRKAFRATDYLTGDVFSVAPTEAGWWATQPAPNDIGRYYPAVYYGEQPRRYPALVEFLQSCLYRWRARWVNRHAGGVGRVLDVGCGPGHLLARFRDLGWTATGTEATPEAAEIPRRRYGLDVKSGELRRLSFATGAFDAVISWHTLEHMRDPSEVLDEAARLLRKGGLFLVSVPDFSSPEAVAKPSAWFHLDVPRHLAHFPAAVLREHLRRRGLSIVKESFLAPEYDAFSLTQTWQNRLGLPHNLLYLILKSATKSAATPSSASQRLAAAGLAILMIPLAAATALWRAWRGRGTVIVILARKT